MKTVRLFFALFVITVTFIATKCCDDFDEQLVYEWSKLELMHVDNSGEILGVGDFETIPKTAYGIRVMLEPLILTRSEDGLNLFPSAYATSCAPGIYQNQDQIDQITIRSLFSFNDSLGTESNITSFFTGRFTFNETQHHLTLTELIDQINHDDFRLIEEFDLYLMKNPNEGNHSFEVSISLSDGGVFTDTTSIVTLR